MAIHLSRIPLPASGNRKRREQPQYCHHGFPCLPPKAWELYIQSRQNARQDRLWQNEEQEKLRTFSAARTENEPLGTHFLFENYKKGTGGVSSCFSGDRVVSFTSGMEGERGGSAERTARFMDDVYPTQVPVWERKERKVSPLVPIHPSTQKPEKSGEEQESIEAMLERCRGAGNYRKGLAQKELLGMRGKGFLSEEVSLFERAAVEGRALEEGFPVHKDED